MSAPIRSQNIKMHHLTYFVQVATSGSLASAVADLGVTQPAVSVAIGDLESILGVPLFQRQHSGMELTVYGETFLHHVLGVRAKLSEAVASIEAMKTSTKGQVRVGIVPMDAVPFFHEGVLALKRSQPRLVISLITGSNERLLRDLRIGGLDFVIGREASSAMMSQLTYEPLFEERMVIAAWPANRLASRELIQLAELVDFPWVLPLANTVIRERIEEEFAKQKVDFPLQYVEGGIATIVNSWHGETDAVVVCPLSLVEEKIAAGALVRLPVQMDGTLPSTGITQRGGGQPSEAAALLMAEFRRSSRERRGAEQR